MDCSARNTKTFNWLLLVIIFAIFASGVFFLSVHNVEAQNETNDDVQITRTNSFGMDRVINYNELTSGYDPVIRPSNFTHEITNDLFSLPERTKFIYLKNTDEGIEQEEVFVTTRTELIDSVRTRVVHDRVWLNGDLVEDTEKYYAQDKEGNVWYFGEDTKTIQNGRMISRDGSWQSGRSGAKAGIIMLADPKVGDDYLQAYYPGQAEDAAIVVATGLNIQMPYGDFSGCLQTRESSPLESGYENNYYCPTVHNVVYEVEFRTNDSRGEDGNQLVFVGYNVSESMTQINGTMNQSNPNRSLVSTTSSNANRSLMNISNMRNSTGSLNVSDSSNTSVNETSQKTISPNDAIRAAQGEVSGTISSIQIENQQGKTVYAVKVINSAGNSTVYVDINSGQVVGIAR